MAQHDYNIANGTGAAVRSDLNNALAAIVSNNSGSTEPATTFAFQWWADTNASQLKLRNAANDDWIVIQELDGTLLMEDGTAGSPGLAFASDLSTGFFRPAADQLAIATNGTERVEFGTSEVVFNDGGADVDFRIEGDTNANLFFVDASADAIGIGTTSPGSYQADANNLVVGSGSGSEGITIAAGSTGWSSIYFADGTTGTEPYRGFVDYGHTDDVLRFGSAATERARIDSSGRLLVGTSTSVATGSSTAGLQLHNTATANGAFLSVARFANDATGGKLAICKSRNSTVAAGTIVQSGDTVGVIEFAADDGTDLSTRAAEIAAYVDGTPGSNDMPGRLVFSTTADGASTPTERMRITSGGRVQIADDGSYYTSGQSLSVSTSSNGDLQTGRATNASYASKVLFYYTSRAASNAYEFLRFASAGATDAEFRLVGDGNAYADGSWSGGGADYAEYFEWADGNTTIEDRRGISVVLDGDKIREAVAGEEPIGAISGNPSVVGDADIQRWKGKYLRDDFGTYIQEDYEVEDEDGNTVIQQRRKLNPAYNPDVEYVSREDRPEWDCVGLMGKLRIRKGQVTGARWIKMRDISDSVEEWLVR